jgi:hypothetical protein
MPLDHPSDWQEEDLLALIRDRIEESLELEYKASPSLEDNPKNKKEIGKDVSAFANSAGGTLVYGIPEMKGVPQPLDGGLDPIVTTKEWLEQVIHGGIRPINPVPLSTQHVGRVAYVISIPQGLTAHQASDYRYYKRSNFQLVPMEDHEIRDVMNRSRHPIIEPVFSFNDNRERRPSLYLRIVLRNIGAMRARDIKIVVAIPHGLFSSEHSQFVGGTTRIEEQTYSTFALQRTDLIIFPEDELPLTDQFGPISSLDRIHQIQILTSPLYDLRWKIYADDMPPKEGRLLLKDIPVS